MFALVMAVAPAVAQEAQRAATQGPRFEAPGSPLSLDDLENRIDSAPALLAARTQAGAAYSVEQMFEAKAGFQYEAATTVGPRSDIVVDGINNDTLRFTQRAGIRLPLLGEKLANEVNVADAQRDVLLGDIDVGKQRRDRLNALRTAFVQFWQTDDELGVSLSYLDAQRRLQPMAHALRRDGFWTPGNFLDFLDLISRAKHDVIALQEQKRAAFAAMQATLGAPIDFGKPVLPNFHADCNPQRDTLIDAAVRTDPESLAYGARTEDVQKLLPLVKNSTLDASAALAVGATEDIPRGAGYDVTAGLDVSAPHHARLEEAARTSELNSMQTSYDLLAQQRRAEIAAGIDKALADYSAAEADVEQARQDVAARREDLRTVRIRNDDLETPPKVAFADLENQMAEQYSAERERSVARGRLLQAGVELIALAPSPCGAKRKP